MNDASQCVMQNKRTKPFIDHTHGLTAVYDMLLILNQDQIMSSVESKYERKKCIPTYRPPLYIKLIDEDVSPNQ